LVLFFVLAASFAAWNLRDEMYMISTYMQMTVFFLAWLLTPFIVMLFGLRSKSPQALRAFLVLEFLQMCLFFLYALNGSTQGLMGAEHLHLFIVPVMLNIFTIIILSGLFLSRFLMYLSRRNK